MLATAGDLHCWVGRGTFEGGSFLSSTSCLPGVSMCKNTTQSKQASLMNKIYKYFHPGSTGLTPAQGNLPKKIKNLLECLILP